jgi:hypothetical protein
MDMVEKGEDCCVVVKRLVVVVGLFSKELGAASF